MMAEQTDISELKDTGLFSDMSSSVDEEDIEMHLPYIRHIFSWWVISPLFLRVGT